MMEQEFTLQMSVENHVMFHVFWCTPQEVAQFFVDQLSSEATTISSKMAIEFFEEMVLCAGQEPMLQKWPANTGCLFYKYMRLPVKPC